MFCHVLIFFAVQFFLLFSPSLILGETTARTNPPIVASTTQSSTFSRTFAGEVSQNGTDDLIFSPSEISTSPFFMPPDPLVTSLRIVSSLVFVILCILGISWLVNHGYKKKYASIGQILGVFPLDNRRFIYLINILGRVLVLGVTEHQINLICEISDKQTLDSLHNKESGFSDLNLDSIFRFLKRKTVHSEGLNDETRLESEENLLREHNETTHHNMKRVEGFLLKRNDSSENPENKGR